MGHGYLKKLKEEAKRLIYLGRVFGIFSLKPGLIKSVLSSTSLFASAIWSHVMLCLRPMSSSVSLSSTVYSFKMLPVAARSEL